MNVPEYRLLILQFQYQNFKVNESEFLLQLILIKLGRRLVETLIGATCILNELLGILDFFLNLNITYWIQTSDWLCNPKIQISLMCFQLNHFFFIFVITNIIFSYVQQAHHVLPEALGPRSRTSVRYPYLLIKSLTDYIYRKMGRIGTL